MDQPRASNETIELAQVCNRFGLRLYQELAKGGNCFFSPVSIATVLSALITGARGASRRELASLLGVRDEDSSYPDRVATLLASLLKRRGVDWEWRTEGDEAQPVEREFFTLRLANGLFVHRTHPLSERYRKVFGSAFLGDVITVDFERPEVAAIRINQWVSDRTEERINQIAYREHITSATRLVLASAAYYLAQWEQQFDKGYTQHQPFDRSTEREADIVDVPIMHQTLHVSHMADRGRGFEAVSIPYRSMSMIVLLPDRGRFHDVEAILEADLVNEIVSRFEGRQITLGLPRFEISSSYELRNALARLGLGEVIDSRRADFGKITNDHTGLFLSELLHAARIRIDEDGTEATGAAIVRMSFGVAVPRGEPRSFVVDRPFLFCVWDDQTRCILFIGRVVDPLH